MAAGYAFHNMQAQQHQQQQFAWSQQQAAQQQQQGLLAAAAQQQQQLAWAQQQQLAYVQQQQQQLAQLQQAQLQHAAASNWSRVATPSGFDQHGSTSSWGAGQGAAESDPVDTFLQELGIEESEDAHFAWIAEYGLQSEVMPARWSMHVDPTTGHAYYVDGDMGTTTWQNPLTDILKVIVEIGRRYLQGPTDPFFTEQKDALWEQHKRELACWHGPLQDDAGRPYYSNSTLGVSSWHDPRDETQFIFELESNLLDALEETLFGLGPEDLPTFGVDEERMPRARIAENGAEILILDQQEQEPLSPHSVASVRRIAEQAALDLSEHQCMFERMTKDAKQFNELHRESEESQKLMISRKVKERRQRKQRLEDDKEQALRDQEAIKKALADAEEEKKTEIIRQMKLEQEQAEEARQQKLAEAQAARELEERVREEERQREKEERIEAEKKAEAERKAEERRRKVEAEKAREREEARGRLRARLLEVVLSHDLEAIRAFMADMVALGMDAEIGPVKKVFKEELIGHLLEVVKNPSLHACRTAIADAESVGGLEEELVPVRQTFLEQLELRNAALLKARKQQEELAAQFKDAAEAKDFGGVIMVAQWRAAVREVAKPFVDPDKE